MVRSLVSPPPLPKAWVVSTPLPVAPSPNCHCQPVTALVEENPFYRTATVPGGMYRGNDEDVQTFGVGATFVTSANVSDEAVYAVVSSVFENFEDFKGLHPAFANLKASLPLHFQNALNLSPLIALICAVAMIFLSDVGRRTEQDGPKAELVVIPKNEFTMTAEETQKYRRFLTGLLVFLAAVVLFFSPLVF